MQAMKSIAICRLVFAAGVVAATLAVAGSSAHAKNLPETITILTGEKRFATFGWEIVGLGDQNDDGFDDFVTHDQQWRAYFFHGGNPFDTIPYMIIDSASRRFSNIGDWNGDGYDDIAIDSWNTRGWKTNIFFLGPDADTTRDLWFGADSPLPFGYTRRADLDQDGVDELVGWTQVQKSLLRYDLGASFDSLPDHELFPPGFRVGDDYSFGENIFCEDFNGDGSLDLLTNFRRPEQFAISGQMFLYLSGSGFDTLPDLVFPRPGPYHEGHYNFGNVSASIGDVNGDSYPDFFAASVSRLDSVGFVFFGGPQIDTLPDLTIYEGFSIAAAAGDVNNDGYDDFMVAEPTEYSTWGWVVIYFGGPGVDNVPDVTIDVNAVEGHQKYFGREIAAVGDINGDGIDDIAVAAQDINSRGQIFLYAGWDGSVDVEPEDDPILPDGFVLHQNYPNPFNPSTTILFEVPRKSHVTLTVHNVLGQEVRRLMDREVSTGAYRVEWDGCDESGHAVASGTYVYRLRAGEVELSRKMVLVR